MPEIDSFTGARKAAIFLAAMGADVSAKVFKSLDEAEIYAAAGIARSARTPSPSPVPA